MKTKNILCILAIVLLTFACSKKDLDVKSTRQLASSYYQYDEHLDNAINGAYAPLQAEVNNWGVNTWLWGACANGEDAWAGGGNVNDRAGYQESNTHTMSPSEPDLQNLWRFYFQGINRCNIIIAATKPESDIKKNAIGQAKFMQAFYYFYLARMFGGLPLMSKVPLPAEKDKRATLDETYTFIENLLKDAIDVGIQERVNGKDPENGLATKASAQALLGKVYLYHAGFIDESGTLTSNKSNFESAVAPLSAVANNPNYALEKNFYQVFTPGNLHGIESVFEVNFTQAVTNGAQGNPLSTLCGPRCSALAPINDTINYGWGFNQPTQELKDFFISQNDMIRLNATFFDTASLQAWHKAAGRRDVLIWQNVKSGYWDRKHYSNPKLFVAWNGNANPMRVLRLADVYLMLAEALLQSGAADPAGNTAAHYVNLVRARVNRPDLASVTMNDIKIERRLELALEGERYFDLVRWGDASTALLAKPDANILSWDDGLPGKESHGLWPIPTGDLTRTSGPNALIQNPGY